MREQLAAGFCLLGRKRERERERERGKERGKERGSEIERERERERGREGKRERERIDLIPQATRRNFRNAKTNTIFSL